MTAAGTAEQDSHESDSVAEQHCSAKFPDQVSLHWRTAYAEAEPDFVASASDWQAIPVSSVLHHLDLGDLVHHILAHVELDRSTLLAHAATDRTVKMMVHRIGMVPERMHMVVVDVRTAEPEQARQKQAKPSAPFAWLE